MLNVQNPLHRGQKCWVPFKYKNLSIFYFGCGLPGHNLRDCWEVSVKVKELSEDDYPFSVALKAEVNLVGKISLALGIAGKKTKAQCSYVGEDTRNSVLDMEKEDDVASSRIGAGALELPCDEDCMKKGDEFLEVGNDVMTCGLEDVAGVVDLGNLGLSQSILVLIVEIMTWLN